MKILVIPNEPNPNMTGRHYLLSKTLLDSNNEIHEIVWDLPHKMNVYQLIRHLFTSMIVKQYTYEGIFIHKIGRLPGFWPIVNGWLFKHQVSKIFKDIGADIIFAESFTNETPVPKNLPYIYDLADDYAAFGEISSSLIYRLAFKLLGVRSTMERQCRDALAVTTVSTVLYDYAKTFNENVVMLPNGVDTKIIKTVIKNSPDESYGKHSIIYVSGFGSWSRSIETIKVVQKLKEEFPDIQLQLVGDGTEVQKIKKYIRMNRLEGFVQYLGFIGDRDKLFSLIQKNAIGLNISEKNIWRDAAQPIKVLEYTALSKKVVSTNLKGVEALNFSNVYIFTDTIKHDDFLNELRNALVSKNNPSDYSELSSYVLKDYDWSLIVTKLISVAEQAIVKWHAVKVLFITQEFSLNGGAGVYAFELVKSMSEHGLDIHVMTLGSKTMVEDFAQGITIHQHKTINLPILRVPVHHLQVLFRSRNIIKKYKINIIHTNNNAGAFSYSNLPMVATIHHPAAEEVKRAQGIQRIIYQADCIFEKIVIKRSFVVTVPSISVKNLLKDYYPSMRIVVLQNGIDMDLFKIQNASTLRSRVSTNESDTIIFFPGGARSRRKGALDLIAALEDSKIQNFKCLISGGTARDIGWGKELHEALDKSTLVNNFIFLGELDYYELPDYYSACDIVVYPSTFEGFGLPALEALACGKPLICTRTGEMPHIVKSGYNGILVQPACPSELRDAIEHLMDSKSLRDKFARNARQSIVNYSWDSISVALINLYNKAVHADKN